MKDDRFDPMEGDPLDDPPTTTVPKKSKKKPKPKPKSGWKRHYTQVPDEWVKRLHKARHPGSTWSLALELLYLQWKAENDGKGDEDIVVAGEAAKRAEISRASKFNALAELEQLGLILTTREPGKAPRAKLLHTEELP